MADADASVQQQALAQFAQPQAATVAAAPSWIGDDPELLKYFARMLENPRDFEASFFRYSPDGPGGISQLVVQMFVDYSDHRAAGRRVLSSQPLRLAAWACICLDMQAGVPGQWGPECKIVKFLKRPQGRVGKDVSPGAREGDYHYIPPKAGFDTARYILGNGAGKQVEVTAKIWATDYREP